MSYTALYRKWRPDRFSDVKGQDHIVTTLKNQILADRIGHAYLFCGTRGTGKTTIAKIFAKTVNCEHPVDGSPCGECASCKSIAAGNSMNVIEIDAASNNGVDNIRQIRDEVVYSPSEGRYKVYIIDEVHMLSIGAFNALLKTLEEPPSYVIFILATTEAHKIPVTILSRCQRYDFKRIGVDTICARLRELMKEEKIEAEDKAVQYIAKAADGAMRDALSLLDQCVAFYYGQTLTYDKVLEVLGAVDTEVFSELLRLVMAGDIKEAIHLLEKIVMQGRDLSQFVVDFTWYLRNLLLLCTSEDAEEVIDMSTENLARLKEEAEIIDQVTLMRYIRIFSELSADMKYATMKRIYVEMAIIKLCKPSMETDLASMLERIRALEEKMESGVFVRGSADGEAYPLEETASEKQITKAELPKALSEDIREVVKVWTGIIPETPGVMHPFLKQCKLTAKEDDVLLIVAKNKLASDFLNKDMQRDILQKVINEKIGKEVQFQIIHLEEHQSFQSSYVDLSKVIMTEIEIEES